MHVALCALPRHYYRMIGRMALRPSCGQCSTMIMNHFGYPGRHSVGLSINRGGNMDCLTGIAGMQCSGMVNWFSPPLWNPDGIESTTNQPNS